MAEEIKKDAQPAPAPAQPAAKAPEAAPKAKEKYIVSQEFHDIVNFDKIHKVGDNVSSMDADRLKELVEAHLVKIEK